MADLLDGNKNSASTDPASSGGLTVDPTLLRPGADAPKADELPSIPVPADVGVIPQEPQPAPAFQGAKDNLIVPENKPPATPPPAGTQKSSKRNLVIGLVAVFILLSTGLAFVFVTNQQSVGDIRNRAVDHLYPNGTSCSANNQCLSGYCDGPSGVCKPATSKPNGVLCSNDSECASGFCHPNLLICATPLLDNGFNCNSNSECKSNYCDGPSGVCKPGELRENGFACNVNTDCRSGYCDGPSGVCKPATSRALGMACVNHIECASGYCDPVRSICALRPTVTPGACNTGTQPYTCSSTSCSVTNYHTCWVAHYYCPDQTLTGGGCQENETSGLQSVSFSNLCGVQQIDVWCEGYGEMCGSNPRPYAASIQQIKTENCGGGGGTPGPTNPPGGSTSTPTPSITSVAPQCNSIKVYKNGVVVTPSTLRPGDAIVIAVDGGNASKARIRINGSAFTETSIKNSSGEYILDYTIPTGQSDFTIEGEIFGVDGLWH